MPAIFLSVVIPVYNEEARIRGTLDRVVSFLAEWHHTWEVIIADDGSTDASPGIIAEFTSLYPNLHALRLPHRGKGWAVKNGMLGAQGEYRLLCDADLSVPIEQVERLLPPKTEGADIAIGSREAAGARRIGEPERRHIMGRAYNMLVRILAVPGVRDTQCGFKCFRGAVTPQLFQDQTMDGFSFDVETLLGARRAGMALKEVGVDWHYREHSKVRPLRDSLAMTCDLLRIRWRYRSGWKPEVL